MEQGWIKIQGYESPIKAEMDKQLLEDNGIPAIVMNKQDSLLKFGRIDLYVYKESVEEVLVLLKEREEE